MKYFDFLHQIQSQLQEMNDFKHDLLITDFLVPSKSQNSLIVKEGADAAEVLVCIEERILQKFQNTKLPRDFRLEHMPDLSIVVEELSHFNTFCLRVESDQPISQLELEVQAEVDKFALALDWLNRRNEENFAHHVFDALFEKCELGDWVESAEDRKRYQEAHDLARNFCRGVMSEMSSHSDRRKAFRNFFRLSREEKLSIPTKS